LTIKVNKIASYNPAQLQALFGMHIVIKPSNNSVRFFSTSFSNKSSNSRCWFSC